MAQTILQNIKILDLSRVLAGPYATQILSDHGAEVIKVEPPIGDETRSWGPPFNENGDASYFLSINRNKKSIAIDLRTAAGRDIILKLINESDVVIENFKQGTMEKWGLDYPALKDKSPKLIYCSMSGFGEKGPLAGKVGYDALTQAMSGLASINGFADKPPCRIGIPIVDMVTGLYSAIAILMALQEREQSGKGQHIKMSLYNSALSILRPHAYNWLLSGKEPTRHGNSHPNIVPYSQFRTKTCLIFVGCGNNGQFHKLCDAIGASHLKSDPRYINNADRLTHHDELMNDIQSVLLEVDGEKLAHELLDMGIPVGKVASVGDVLQDPQTLAEGMLIEENGYKGIASPIKFSRSETQFTNPPPAFSEHYQEILSGLGLSEDEIEQLLSDKVVLNEKVIK